MLSEKKKKKRKEVHSVHFTSLEIWFSLAQHRLIEIDRTK